MGDLDFDAIIESIYDASDDPAGFVPALRKVGALLGASGNHTLVIETATNAAENHAYGADEASFDEHNRHWRQQDPRFAHAVGDVYGMLEALTSRSCALEPRRDHVETPLR